MNLVVEDTEQPEGSDHRFVTFTGFCVIIDDFWFWITSDHAFDPEHGRLNHVEGQKQYRISMDRLSREPGSTMPYAVRMDQVFRGTVIGRKLLGKLKQGSKQHAEFAAIANDFDIAAVHMSDYYIGHLKSLGIEPLTRAEYLENDEVVGREVREEQSPAYLCGCPASSLMHTEYGFDNKFKCLPVKLIEYDPPLARFIQRWRAEDHEGSMVGFSGGPIVVLHRGRTLLLGVDFAAITTKGQTIVRAIDPRPLFRMLEHAVKYAKRKSRAKGKQASRKK